jgi:hypothetical protein
MLLIQFPDSGANPQEASPGQLNRCWMARSLTQANQAPKGQGQAYHQNLSAGVP